MWHGPLRGQWRCGREAPSPRLELRARAPGTPRAARRGRLVVKGLRTVSAADTGAETHKYDTSCTLGTPVTRADGGVAGTH